MKVRTFIEKNPFQLTHKLISSYGDRKEYRCTISVVRNVSYPSCAPYLRRESWEFPFSCGKLAGRPTKSVVLECLVGDAQIGQNNTFNEYVKELSSGDLFEDFRCYVACQDTMRALQRLFGLESYEQLMSIDF